MFCYVNCCLYKIYKIIIQRCNRIKIISEIDKEYKIKKAAITTAHVNYFLFVILFKKPRCLFYFMWTVQQISTRIKSIKRKF